MYKPEDNQSLSKQGNSVEKEDQMGCATNVMMEQLNKGNGIAHLTEDNPDNIENPDDLHEIKVDDDLNEPDAEEQQGEPEVDNRDLTGAP